MAKRKKGETKQEAERGKRDCGAGESKVYRREEEGPGKIQWRTIINRLLTMPGGIPSKWSQRMSRWGTNWFSSSPWTGFRLRAGGRAPGGRGERKRRGGTACTTQEPREWKTMGVRRGRWDGPGGGYGLKVMKLARIFRGPFAECCALSATRARIREEFSGIFRAPRQPNRNNAYLIRSE